MATASFALISARYGRHKPPNNIFIIVVLLIVITLLLASISYGKQMQPDAKRIHEIQAALIAHGYEPGRSWGETQELLRDIARLHHWQIKHAPDARVLILLGLGNKYSDPSVAEEGANHLDGGKDEE